MRLDGSGLRLQCAIYARHSTDKQTATSSDDQAEACLSLVHRLDGDVVGTFTDPEISGYRRDRPGLLGCWPRFARAK